MSELIFPNLFEIGEILHSQTAKRKFLDRKAFNLSTEYGGVKFHLACVQEGTKGVDTVRLIACATLADLKDQFVASKRR